MGGEQEKSFWWKAKDFLVGNTVTSNLLLGAVGLFSLPLMGSLIGANTTWKTLPKNEEKNWIPYLKTAGSQLFSTLLGGVAGATMGIVGSAVVGVATVLGGPAGLVVGMGLTGLAASYLGKDAAVKQKSAPTHPAPTAEAQAKEKNNSEAKGRAKDLDKTKARAEDKMPSFTESLKNQIYDLMGWKRQPQKPAQQPNQTRDESRSKQHNANHNNTPG